MISKRNGKIELLRFVFCISVLLYHISKDIWDLEKFFGDYFSFFSHGRTGVEFFFLVSGFLAAKKVYSTRDDNVPIGESTYRYIFEKIKSVFLPHLIITVLIIITILVSQKNPINAVFDRLPSIFFLQRSGISVYAFSTVEWYICSMLLALAVIYPMLKKNYDVTARIIAPVASVTIIGYLIQTYHSLPNSSKIAEFTYNGNVRAFAVVLLGVFCFEVSRRIREIKLTKMQSIALIAVENLCWIFSLYFVVSQMNKKYEGFVALALAAAVTLTFSRDINSKIYNNKFVYFLGKISLPVYLSQALMRLLAKTYLSDLRALWRALFIFAGTVLLGIALHYICIFIRKRMNSEKTKITQA